MAALCPCPCFYWRAPPYGLLPLRGRSRAFSWGYRPPYQTRKLAYHSPYTQSALTAMATGTNTLNFNFCVL